MPAQCVVFEVNGVFPAKKIKNKIKFIKTFREKYVVSKRRNLKQKLTK